MPYWKRPEALEANIAAYRRFYGDDLEIIVANDGSDDLPAVAATIVSLPPKDRALNPCVAFNAGARAAQGDVLLLTNPEVVHREPILAGMLASLSPRAYVAAACWSPKLQWWFAHSTLGPDPNAVGRAPMPPGSAFHFCALLHRSLYDEIGGFSEEYREGQGYEDNDLLWKLHSAGARFVIRDDLVTEHIDCPRTVWPAGGAARNKSIFEAKWPNL